MKSIRITAFIIVSFCMLFFCFAEETPPVLSKSVSHDALTYDVQKAIDNAIAAVKPALVRIFAVTTMDIGGRNVKQESSGSGVVISKDGYIITNYHVVGRTVQLICTLSTKEEIEADVIGTDPLSDIAVIKLRYEGKRTFPYAHFGNSRALSVGDYVLAMGSPFALSQSVTMGIISNTELVMPQMFWPFNELWLEGENVGSLVRWIGHDAPIYGGNSGGPLVNLQGEVVGINEISFGLSGAIPAYLAKEVAASLIDKGTVIRSWYGLDIQPRLEKNTVKKGVLVAGTIKDSPAQKAGFISGDIIISVNAQDVDVGFAEEIPLFNQLLVSQPVGQKVLFKVLREGKEVTLTCIPEEREYMHQETVELKSWGITARNLSLLAAKEMKRDTKDGVWVTSVRAGMGAGEAKPPIISKDIIVKVNDHQIKNLQDLRSITEKITESKQKPQATLVTFERGKKRYVTVVKVGVKELEDPGLEVRKAWIPVATQVLTSDIARALGLSGQKGVRIAQVYPATGAEQLGLKVGDIVVALDDDPIEASEPQDIEVFPAMVRQYKIGAEVMLTVLRDKKELKIPVVLMASPRLDREMKEYRDGNFEFTVRDVAFYDTVQEEWDVLKQGVLVEQVDEGSWAAIARLAVGDLIVCVDDAKIDTIEDFSVVMEALKTKKPKSVVFEVVRGIHTLYIELKPQWATLSDAQL